LFDVIPKILATQQFCEIAPDSIPLLGKLKGEPQCELVILYGVADEKGVSGNIQPRFGFDDPVVRHVSISYDNNTLR
jgi:hypothetical protein